MKQQTLYPMEKSLHHLLFPYTKVAKGVPFALYGHLFSTY